MLKQLGIDLDFLPSTVSIGFGDEIVKLSSGEIARVMEYMEVLYGIDNPLFLDLKSDPQYVFKTILPWISRPIIFRGSPAPISSRRPSRKDYPPSPGRNSRFPAKRSPQASPP